MNMTLLRFGGSVAVAIYGVIMTLASIIEQILYGVIDALQPAIGYNYGAREFDRVKSIEKYVLISAFIISIIGGAVMLIFPAQTASVFLDDRSFIDIAVFAVRITGFYI